MALSPGARLGSYEIIAPLGAGGMGEVYRARDTKLNRDVAVKILPDAFASDADRVARFTREAQTLAALNHPHIAQIYGLEQSSTTSALVMELVEGEDLAQRIARGPIAIDDALPIARQICEAIEAAHEQGIVHRDLKPGNIKVRADGTVKVLDFGLAKALWQDPSLTPHASRPAAAATITSPAMTAAGMLLGTAAYMSPEQARGNAVDKRADIWAFGCVLYEMLTGTAPFAGATTTDILAAIVHKTPDWDALPVNAPIALRRLVRRCVEKDRKRRLADIADARLEIDEALAGAPEQVVGPARRPRTRVVLLSAIAALAVGLVGVFAGWLLRQTETGVPARFTIPLPAGDTFGSLGMAQGAPDPVLALSPDGRTLVYAAVRGGVPRLFRRALDEFREEPLPGTEGAYAPFFSRDGEWLGFFDPAGVKKMPFPSGAPIEIAKTYGPSARGGALARDGTLIFAPSLFGPLAYHSRNVAAAANVSTGPSSRDRAIPAGLAPTEHWPDVMPDGKAVLFAEGGFDLTSWDEARIVAQSIDGRTRKILIEGGTYPRYVPSGHLLYARAGSLMAIRFDPRGLETAGTAVRVLDGVAQSIYGAAQYAVANDGTLAYLDGVAPSQKHGVVWLDRNGRTTALNLPPNYYWAPRLSPDGLFVAFSVFGPATDVWTYDLARETLTRLSTDSQNTRSTTPSHPVWTPDGTRIVYEQVRDGQPARLYWRQANGAGAEERLTDGGAPQQPNCWLPDGKTLLFTQWSPETRADLWTLAVEGDRKPVPFLQTSFEESGAACSPDGRWVAYVSDESGGWEVYVRPLRGPGGYTKISNGGGMSPAWTRDGKNLLYVRTEGNPVQFWSVPVSTVGGFVPGKPVMIHTGRYYWDPATNYDVASDGRMLLLPSDDTINRVGSIRIIQRWFDELKRRVP